MIPPSSRHSPGPASGKGEHSDSQQDALRVNSFLLTNRPVPAVNRVLSAKHPIRSHLAARPC